jgi:dethiobiotin synthetase
MKPVQTGCRRRAGRLLAPDLEFCLRQADLKVSAAERRRMAPYCLAKACSPHLAAAGARRRIVLPRIVAAFHALAKKHKLVIVEGAGGLLVPLNEKDTMLDLIKALGLPVILVARPGLGTINHTLLSLREMDRAGIKPLGVVFNAADRKPWGDIERDNGATVARRGRVSVLGRLPRLAKFDSAALIRMGREHLPLALAAIRNLMD